MELQRCLYCKEPLHGRSDKKYCDQQCRNAYNNQVGQLNENYIRLINKQLRLNRSSLRKSCPEGKATVRKAFLLGLGMNFKYYTHTWTSKGGNLYYFCYDYGYTPSVEEDKIVVIQHQEYMK